jgi:hypothetical protein
MRIDNEKHRNVEELGNMRCACNLGGINPVKKTHYSLYYAEISALRAAYEGFKYSSLSHHEAVQIPGRTLADRCMVGRVDEIGSDLERLDFVLFAQGSHYAKCDCGFTNAAACACD